jgi:hypothetical protein
MRATYTHLASAAAAVIGLCGCGGASGQEPTEAQMKEAMLYVMNHPPGTTQPDAAITMKFFKKQACDKPTPQGFNCTFNVEVASTDIGLGWYNNLQAGVFYKDDKGKWQMRPPF